MCVLSRFSCVHFFVTLWTVALQAPLSLAFSRQEQWSGLPCPLPGDVSNPGIEPTSLMSPVLVGRFFITSATWEAPIKVISSVQSLSLVRLFVTPWTTACQASLSITNFWSLLKLMLSRFVIAFLPRSRPLLISWQKSHSAVILEPKKRKSVTTCTFSLSICDEVMGPFLWRPRTPSRTYIKDRGPFPHRGLCLILDRKCNI